MPIKSIDQILYHTKNKIIKILDTKKSLGKIILFILTNNLIIFNTSKE